ncbi:LLM class flavin-dependent oxidoreductase [Terribacillus saccharophilus]|uniref:LLM class flavin-dependent oxidoreductase n=1 Tax=Terribacillus saccharophilus TaxID=361277 RepID=UPI003981A338
MNKQSKQMKLGLFLAGYGHHVAAWRHPEANTAGPMDLDHLIHTAKNAESGKFDMVFLADSLFVSSTSHPNIISRYEPLTLLSALSRETTNIGLAATASTTYSEPFHVARQFSSLDHLSNGRAAWNVVTSSIPQTAENFNGSKHMEHELRYERAQEFVEVVTSLWNSWEELTLIRDKENGVFVDAKKMLPINHSGKHFKVKGPLNIERSPQGKPVLIQAGSSPAGTTLAAQIADVVFTAQTNLEDARAFYKTIKEKAASFGRNPNHVLIMPGIFPVIAETDLEAKAEYEKLQNLIPKEIGLGILSNYLGGIDLSHYSLDSKFNDLEINEIDGVQSRFQLIKKMALKENLTLEQLYKRIAGSRGHHVFIGTAEALADKLEEWVLEEACDGFNIMPPLLAGQFDTFIEKVIPILQERGIYKKDYEGNTLRERLGLPQV